MTDEIQAPQGAPISNYVEFMVANWINKMTMAEAAKEWHSYYTYCTNALQLVKSHIDLRDRAGVQRDWDATRKALAEAEKIGNAQTQINTILMIKKAFADAHKYYIYDALPGMGIIKNEEDGVIDFNSLELTKVMEIVRSNRGMEEAITSATTPEAKEDEA